MVKRYYVIIVGLKVGVFHDHWTNVAPLVKNKQDSIWQGASSAEEAEELFEQARRKRYVRVISSELARSSTPSRAQTNSVRRSPNTSSSSGGNPQPSRYTPAPRVVESQSEAHVWNSASHYVPARPSSGKTVTAYNPSDRASGNSPSAAKVLSRAYSEPRPQTHSPSLRYGRSPFREPASKSGTGTLSQVKVDNTGIRARVESPSWLASYPDEEDEAFITPPLSPITSPRISSGLLGPSGSEPASTISANFGVTGANEGKPAWEDRSEAFRSPKPVPQFPSSAFRSQGSPNQVHLSADDSLIDLVNRVDMLVKDLRIRVISPSTRITDVNLSYTDRTFDHPHEFGQRSPAINVEVEEQHGSVIPVSPHSSSTRHKLLPTNRAPTTTGMKNMSNGDFPGRSILFSQSRGSPAPISSPAPTCRHCNGTGFNAGDDTSILERTGLSQPSLAPFHSHDTQDPRSPFTGSNKLYVPSSPVTFGRPSPTVHTAALRATPSPSVTSPARRS